MEPKACHHGYHDCKQCAASPRYEAIEYKARVVRKHAVKCTGPGTYTIDGHSLTLTAENDLCQSLALTGRYVYLSWHDGEGHFLCHSAESFEREFEPCPAV